MPFSDPRSHFADILQAIRTIRSFIEGMDFRAYSEDLKTRNAVERQLQILTEAVYRLKDDAELLCPGPDWRGYRGMGNLLRHAYERIDDAIVWRTLVVELPDLETTVMKCLARLG